MGLKNEMDGNIIIMKAQIFDFPFFFRFKFGFFIKFNVVFPFSPSSETTLASLMLTSANVCQCLLLQTVLGFKGKLEIPDTSLYSMGLMNISVTCQRRILEQKPCFFSHRQIRTETTETIASGCTVMTSTDI